MKNGCNASWVSEQGKQSDSQLSMTIILVFLGTSKWLECYSSLLLFFLVSFVHMVNLGHGLCINMVVYYESSFNETHIEPEK